MSDEHSQLANDLYNAKTVTLIFEDWAEHGSGWQRPVELSNAEVDVIVAALRELASVKEELALCQGTLESRERNIEDMAKLNRPGDVSSQEWKEIGYLDKTPYLSCHVPPEAYNNLPEGQTPIYVQWPPRTKNAE